MQVHIKNTDKEQTLLLTGVIKNSESKTLFPKEDESKMVRYILRPGEESDFTLQDNWFLGLEEL